MITEKEIDKEQKNMMDFITKGFDNAMKHFIEMTKPEIKQLTKPKKRKGKQNG